MLVYEKCSINKVDLIWFDNVQVNHLSATTIQHWLQVTCVCVCVCVWVHVGGACSHFSFPSMMRTQLCWNQSVLKLGSTRFSQPNSPTYCWTMHKEPCFIFLSSMSFRNMEKSFLWFMPKSLFMLSVFLTLFLCIQLNPSMFYWACVICLFIYRIPSFFPLSFSHAGLQVLGHYIRRQQDPETFISEIKYIASDPDDKYFFNVTDEAALNDIVDALGDRIFTLEGL